jgi:hypothetical protein
MSSIDFLSWLSICKSTYLSRSAPLPIDFGRAWSRSRFRNCLVAFLVGSAHGQSILRQCCKKNPLWSKLSTTTHLIDLERRVQIPINWENYDDISYFVLLESHWIPIGCKDRQKDFCGTDSLATLAIDIYDEQILSLIDHLFEISASHDFQETNSPKLDLNMTWATQYATGAPPGYRAQ